MWKPSDALQMTEEQRATLQAWVRARMTPQRTVLRARICLLAVDGRSNNAIARHLQTSRPTVLQWRTRFPERGPAGLAEDAPHGLSKKALSAEQVKAIVDATLYTKPPDATHWSTRTMDKAHGVSNATVARIWDAHGLQPQLDAQLDRVGAAVDPAERISLIRAIAEAMYEYRTAIALITSPALFAGTKNAGGWNPVASTNIGLALETVRPGS